ncbi:MAG: SgcJ/EcaC family oxidoreductase [Gemmatimonadaceae bacterium]|nr:SgcJ/EcaC family oxidoreductase [Gemmatimonadaceae bacterium]
MMRVRTAVLAASLLLVPSLASAQKLSAADEAAVNKIATDYVAAWAKADAKAIAGLHTADAVIVGGDGAVSSGRAAIEKAVAANFAGMFKGTTLKVMPAGTRQLAPNVAGAHGTWEVSAGGKVVASGHFVSTDVKTAEGWKTAHFASFTPQAPPAPPAPAKKK